MLNNNSNKNHTITFENTDRHCPIGDKTANEMMNQVDIPVISCEGYCIRGDIARMVANMLSKEKGYGRACHGEIFAVPQSNMSKWAKNSEKIIVIDGCFLHCHGRMIKGILSENQLVIFDALSFYGKYTDIMDADDIPENERRQTARIVFDKVIKALEQGCSNQSELQPSACGCCDQ